MPSRNRKPADTPSEDTEPADDEFDQFTDLTRKLLTVPKKELDDKLRESKS